MLVEGSRRATSARVIVVGNEKGGSGKSTVAMHVAVALMKSGQGVATIDLDTRQKSFTHHIENRRAWARQTARELETPEHFCFGKLDHPTAEDEAAGARALENTVETLAGRYGVVVIDTPGHDGYLTRVAHSLADTLITPLNDSFVDLDVLGTVDPETFGITGTSHYADMVEEARGRRRQLFSTTDWIVLRNRLSTLGSQQARGRRGAAAAFTAAEFPLRRGTCRTRDLSRILSARTDRGRRSRRTHPRHAAHHVARHRAPGNAEAAHDDRVGQRDNRR